MNIPIRFPSDVDVILEDVARFRALSPEKQVGVLGEMYRLYRFLEGNSTCPEALARMVREEKELERKAIMEFVARHA